MENKKTGFHYAWIVFAATVVMNFVFSIVYSTFSLYAAKVLEANPDITRTAYSVIPTLHSVFATVFLLTYGKIVQKLGFRKTAVHYNSWKNQLGEMESSVDYELTADEFCNLK